MNRMIYILVIALLLLCTSTQEAASSSEEDDAGFGRIESLQRSNLFGKRSRNGFFDALSPNDDYKVSEDDNVTITFAIYFDSAPQDIG
jgi:hypothetical protein